MIAGFERYRGRNTESGKTSAGSAQRAVESMQELHYRDPELW